MATISMIGWSIMMIWRVVVRVSTIMAAVGFGTDEDDDDDMDHEVYTHRDDEPSNQNDHGGVDENRLLFHAILVLYDWEEAPRPAAPQMHQKKIQHHGQVEAKVVVRGRTTVILQ
jgi:hypothetical protein